METFLNQQRKWNTKSHIKRTLMIFALTRNLRGADSGWVEAASEGKLYSTGLVRLGDVPEPNRSPAQLSGALFAGQPLPEAGQSPLEGSRSLSSASRDWGRCCPAGSLFTLPERCQKSLDLAITPLKTQECPSIHGRVNSVGKGEVHSLQWRKWTPSRYPQHQNP